MSRCCTTYLGRRRLSVTQNHTYTARFAIFWTASVREREMTALSEPLCFERTCSTHYQRLGEATLMDSAELAYEGQAADWYFASLAQRRGR
jgi:hypothetical protein